MLFKVLVEYLVALFLNQVLVHRTIEYLLDRIKLVLRRFLLRLCYTLIKAPKIYCLYWYNVEDRRFCCLDPRVIIGSNILLETILNTLLQYVISICVAQYVTVYS